MSYPSDRKYAKTHEWVKDLGNGLFEIGLSDYAQKEMGDIIYLDLPQAGDELKAGESFADLESVKAVSGIQSPINGTVKEVNDEVASSPDLINKSPNESWIIRAEGAIPEGTLLSAEEYQEEISK